MDREANGVPNAECEDLRLVAGLTHELGLSAGTLPSSLSRRILPPWWAGSWAQAVSPRVSANPGAPMARYSLSSDPKMIRAAEGSVGPRDRLEDLADIRELIAFQARSVDDRRPKEF